MLDILFAIGQAFCVFALLAGVYLAIAEMIDTAKAPDEHTQFPEGER
jgi:hypothetical protein